MHNSAIKVNTIATELVATAISENDPILFPSRISEPSLQNEKPHEEISFFIGSQELLSIYALLAQIALSQNVRQELLEIMVEAEFSVEHISKISHADYENVMTFLMDLRMEEIRSRK